MKKRWHLSVKGKGHEVAVDAARPGQDVIRVDGRLAAAPLDFDETQRAFMIDGRTYSLRRRGTSDFDLTPIGAGPGGRAIDEIIVAATMEPAKSEAQDNALIAGWASIAVLVVGVVYWLM